jgi:hypothetical protein
LGATVDWDDLSRKVTVKKGSTTIEIFIDNTTARVNGSSVTLDQPAVTLNGRTVVPARFIAENLGATVDWDDLAKKVTIVGSGGTPAATPTTPSTPPAQVQTGGVAYYANHPTVPDFGAFSGVPLADHSGNSERSFWYRNISKSQVDSYVALIVSQGWVWSSAVGDSNFYKKDGVQIQLAHYSSGNFSVTRN